MKTIILAVMITLVAGLLPAQVTTPHAVPVSWTASVADATHQAATGYNVKRSPTPGGPYTIVGKTVAPVVTYTDTESATNVLTEGAMYYYVISGTATCTATNGTTSPCEGPNSAEGRSGAIPFRVLSAPNAPASVSIGVVR